MKFDIKNLLIGLLLGVSLMLIIGAGTVSTNNCGKYEMIPISSDGPMQKFWVMQTETGEATYFQIDPSEVDGYFASYRVSTRNQYAFSNKVIKDEKTIFEE